MLSGWVKSNEKKDIYDHIFVDVMYWVCVCSYKMSCAKYATYGICQTLNKTLHKWVIGVCVRASVRIRKMHVIYVLIVVSVYIKVCVAFRMGLSFLMTSVSLIRKSTGSWPRCSIDNVHCWWLAFDWGWKIAPFAVVRCSRHLWWRCRTDEPM